MAAQRKTAVTSKAQPHEEAVQQWASLSWDDVTHWAGSRSTARGRRYHRGGRVANLGLAVDGRLLATVAGGDRYVTAVWLKFGSDDSHTLESACTCPVGLDGCKHAVAVVLAFLQVLADKQEVPVARAADPRWDKLRRLNASTAGASGEDIEDAFGEDIGCQDGAGSDEFDEAGDDQVTDESDEPAELRRRASRKHPVAEPVKSVGRRGARRRTRADWDERIRTHVQRQSQPELAKLVCELAERFPELRSEFQERIALAEGDLDRLVNDARRALQAVTAEFGWRNHWGGEGHTPDYTRLRHKLTRLVECGHPDAVVELGLDLLQRGIQQIEQSHDEGETAQEISECLPVVFDALARSSRAAPDKILYAIDACLKDDYDVIGPSADAILGAKWTHADWSIVADRLTERIQHLPHSKNLDDFTRNYQRDRVSNWLLESLERAGRKDELLPVYEAEARVTGSFQRLVEYLLREGKHAEAERWAREGIKKTLKKWPGIAAALLKSLCNLARQRKAWDVVAAHAARDFFERPSVQGFQELVATAEKAKCGAAVRAAALEFLETGKLPFALSAGRAGTPKATVDPAWPLPVPDYLASAPQSGGGLRGTRPARNAPQPHFDVLLQVAITNARPDEVLHWYDKMRAADSRSQRDGWDSWGASASTSYAGQVAASVASTHPERALEIYHRGLDAQLSQASLSAYEACAAYLRKMRPILKALDREGEWIRMVADIRKNYRNRPRFMELLDTLDGRSILQTQKPRRPP